MHANQREEIKEVRAGDIAAAVGLKEVDHRRHAVRPDSDRSCSRSMVFPEPVISQAVEPKTKADQEKMGIALNRLAQEDPSFRVQTDEESGQTIISGMGELHLEIIVDRMKREFGVEANVGKPQVAYRETIRKTVEDVEGKFVKQSGGRGQYGHVVLKLEPQEPGKGFEFVDAIKGGVVPREYIPAVEKGVDETLNARRAGRLPGGRREGHADLRFVPRRRLERKRVQDGRLDRLQGRLPQGAARCILEPMMAVEVETPEDYAGNVMGDLSSPPRHGAGHGRHGRRRQGHQGRSAAVRNVRLLDHAALDDAGPRDLHDGVQALRRSAEERRRRDHHRASK